MRGLLAILLAAISAGLSALCRLWMFPVGPIASVAEWCSEKSADLSRPRTDEDRRL